MTENEKKMHTQILSAIQTIVNESDGELTYSVDTIPHKEFWGKNIGKTTKIVIEIKKIL